MNVKKRGLTSFVSMMACMTLVTTNAFASDLTQKKQVMQELQKQKSQNTNELSDAKVKAQEAQNKIQSYQDIMNQLSTKIQANEAEIHQTEAKLHDINTRLVALQKERAATEQKADAMLRSMYEDGKVPYLAVLFHATSFQDLISRMTSLSILSKAEHQLLDKIVSVDKQVGQEKAQQKSVVDKLNQKQSQLKAMQETNKGLKQQQQMKLQATKQTIQADQMKQGNLNSKISMTQSQIQALEQQISESEAVLTTNVGMVTEPELRYQDISPVALYHYVLAHDSTFSLQDIETICSAAKRYDVNPALLIAITGQEQAFVPPGPDANKIRNNPFNVFYSWQVYNTNLADAANIAADTLRHKLSVPPPNGENAVLWINDPQNPWGIYAQDTHWAYGVLQFFNDIMSKMS